MPAIGLALAWVSLVAAGLWACVQGLIPTWLFFIAVVAAVAGGGLASRRLARTREQRRSKDDPLLAFRHLRAARALRLTGRSTEDCTLELDLVAEWDLKSEPVTISFLGVSQLEVHQMGAFVLHFDHLICDAHPAKGNRPRSLHVRDRWNEFLSFRCRAFEVAGAEAPSQ